MVDWEEQLASSLAEGARKTLGDLSFTRLCWLTENFYRAVVPFLRGDFDRHLKGVIPPMPLREIDAETWKLERHTIKPPDAP